MQSERFLLCPISYTISRRLYINSSVKTQQFLRSCKDEYGYRTFAQKVETNDDGMTRHQIVRTG